MKFTHTSSLRGELTVPGDKSISHRSVMFGALADGLTEIHGFLQGADCLSTISCFSKMGISIENQGETVLVHGRGLHGLTAPDSVLDCGNSGTTTRLISGILSAQKFDTTLTGDASIQKRPMKRIIDPLSQMGAKIESVNGNGCAPLHITGSPLLSIVMVPAVSSVSPFSSAISAVPPPGVCARALTGNSEIIMLSARTRLRMRFFIKVPPRFPKFYHSAINITHFDAFR